MGMWDNMGGLLGFANQGSVAQETTDNSLNPSQQPINKIGPQDNELDYSQRDVDRVQMYKDRNWAMDDTIDQGAWDAYGQGGSVDLSENPGFDPRTANNPVFNSLTEKFGEPTENPDGTWSHTNKPEDGVSDYIGLPTNTDSAAFGAPEDTFANPFSGEVGSYMENQMDRLGITDPQEREDFLTNMHKFGGNVRGMESDNNPLARSSESSASGVYQFTDPSVSTGKTRLSTSGYSNPAAAEAAGVTPYSGDFISGISDDPTQWSSEQADAMFFSNIFSQKGSDDVLRRIGQGEQGADWEGYSKFHHTNPDEATINRGTKFFSGGGLDTGVSYY